MNIIKCECGQSIHMEFDCQICKACGKVNTRKSKNLTSPETIEAEARRLIGGDKREAYGSVQESFANIAMVWTGILRNRKILPADKSISGQEVALLMSALKLIREAHKEKRDNRVDAVAYVLLLDQLIPNTTYA